MSAGRLQALLQDVAGCTACAAHLPLGPRPVLRASTTARLVIVGQAPGTRVHETGVPWNDKSGERLRRWLELTPDEFYDARRIAIVPMGFCYPGRAASGGDNPPRPECAPLWHARIVQLMPAVRLTLLVGAYAQAHYLGSARKRTLTETVAAWQNYLPAFVPLPHPSWRTAHWEKRNPWFATDVLPQVRTHVHAALAARPQALSR